MKRRPTQDIQRSDTHAAALRATDSAVRGILNRLMQTAPAPLDCGGLLSFCVGAASLCGIAAGLLKQPKPEFLMLRDECKALAAACIARFEAAGQTDAEPPPAPTRLPIRRGPPSSRPAIARTPRRVRQPLHSLSNSASAWLSVSGSLSPSHRRPALRFG